MAYADICVLYGLETYSISSKQYRSLHFALNGCFRKIFGTKSAEVVQNCMQMFNHLPVQDFVAKRRDKFLLILLHQIIYYAVYITTVLHVNWIWYTRRDYFFRFS